MLKITYVEFTTFNHDGIYSLSLILFNIILDCIINDVKIVKKGYRIGKEVRNMCYANDTVLIVETADELQQMLRSFNQTTEEYNMQILILISKIKAMTISKQPPWHNSLEWQRYSTRNAKPS